MDQRVKGGLVMSVTIAQLNAMDKTRFMEVLGPVFEHSPWVAEQAWEARPFQSAEQLHNAMMGRVRTAGNMAILALLRAHPDLATRMKVTAFSAGEQSGAGLDRLSQEEYSRFSRLNRTYKEKFGFPFILAVAGKTKQDIIEAMERRIRHEHAAEWDQALAEIGRITEIRLQRMME
jgi:2-oxo-4-hydroxy-4-carboxy-5-ureidoimidazoline decarboxylase